MPTVVATYQTSDWITSPASKDISVTVSAGEKLVIFACTETASATLSGVSGGGITFTNLVSNNNSGRTSNYVWEGTSASSQTFTLTVTKSAGTGWYGAIVVRLSNAGTLGTPGLLQSSGAPQQSMTTSGADSMALVFNGDWNAVSGTTTVATGFGSGVSLLAVQTANYGAYAAYYPDTNAGTADVGWSAPAGQVFNMSYIEVAHSAGGGGGETPVDVTKTGTAATTGGAATWTNAANAEGAANATVATWTNATSGATGTLELSYDFSEIPTDATLNSVNITVRSAVGNTARMQAPQAQVYIGGSAVSTLATLSFNTTLTDSTFTPTLTLSQVRDSTFKVRFTARKQAANAQSSTTTLDSITVVANYTPAASGTNHTSSPADALGVTDSVSVTKTVQVAISDSAGATDNAGSQATGTTNKSQDDALGATDAASVVQANTRSQSDALGVTDSVNANLAAGGGGGGENIRVLAQFASGSTGTSHTVTLSQAPTLNSLFVVAASSGILSVAGDNANWIEVLSQTSGIDIKIWRLPAANYGGNKTSVTITSASNISVAAVVFEAEIDTAGDNYFNLHGTSNGGSGTAWGTGLHTYSGSTDSFAMFIGTRSVASGGLGAMDLSSYDQSFTEFGDSGKAAGGSFDDVRVWIAHNELASMSNNGVTATINQATTASGGSRSGMFALDLLPVAGGPSKSVTDPLGITDSVAVVQSKSVSVSDGLGLTDVLTAQGTGIVSKSQSDALGVTDSVNANLVAGGGATGDGFNVLAQYASPSATNSHTINLSGTPQRNSLFVFAASAGVMTIQGGNGGWVQVYTMTGDLDWKLWRLDDENFLGLTSVTITSTINVALTAFIWEDEADLASITNYWDPVEQTPPNQAATAYGTGLHTFNDVTRAFATFVLANGSDNDITAYDSGFTEVADTGYAPGGAYTALQMFVATNTITSLTNNGVVATLASGFNGTSGGRAGMLAYKALPVSGGASKTVADPLGITDSVAVVKNVSVAVNDTLGVTDSVTASAPGVISKTQSDALGITDSVNAQLNTGGGGVGTNLRKLAGYASTAPSTTHTITLSQSPTLNSLFVIASSAGMMNISGDNANWIQVASAVGDLDNKVWRLNKADFGVNKTTVTITTAQTVALVATIFEAELDIAALGNYWNPYSSTNPSVGATLYGTGLHSFLDVTHAFAYFNAQRNASSGGFSPTYDLTSYDNGFTEFDDTGRAPGGSYNDIRQWMAFGEVTSFTNNGISATSSEAWAAGGGRSGMIAMKLLPVAGAGNYASSPSEAVGITDNVSIQVSTPGNQNKSETIGITDSLVVAKSRSITIADSVSIADVARRAGLSPTIAEENANTTGVQDRDFWHNGLAQRVDIPGFPRSTFYLPGQTAQFSIDYNNAFTFEVWRLGWYGADNNGARKVHTGAGTPTDQPAPTTIPNSNGANHCANWSVNVSWTVPDDATPGWYYVLMYNAARTQFGFMLFCVSDKYEKKNVLIVSSESTWAGAYNYYGGKGAAVLTGPSLYGNGGPMTGGHQARAYAVSLDRPVVTRAGIPQTHFFNGEYAFNRYLERLGVEVGYATNEQCELDPSILDGRTVIIFNGHNEYTSQTLHNKLFDLTSSTQTRIINFGANDFFWRIRYGTTDHFDTSTKGRVIWCRKDTHDGPSGTGHVGGDPIVAGDWGGTWQDTRWQGGANDFAVLMGDRFTRNGVASDNIRVPFSYKTSPLWRSAPVVQALSSGQTADFGAGSAGMEWDSPIPNGEGPPRVALSEAVYTVSSGVSDANGQNYNLTATITHSFQMIRTPSNSFIFNGSTTQWGWCVDNFHDRGSAIASTDARQATVNLLADFGVTIDPSKITAITGLTAPTPVGDIGTAYAVPANTGGGQFNKADTLGILDTVTVTQTKTYNITITDSVSATDTESPQQLGFGEVVADLLGITDTQTLVKTMNRVLTDSLVISDNAAANLVSQTNTINKTQADNLGASDVLTRLVSMSRTFTESLGMTDSVYAYKFVPGSTSFFFWNGSTEAPLQLKVWNGAAEVPASFQGTV